MEQQPRDQRDGAVPSRPEAEGETRQGEHHEPADERPASSASVKRAPRQRAGEDDRDRAGNQCDPGYDGPDADDEQQIERQEVTESELERAREDLADRRRQEVQVPKQPEINERVGGAALDPAEQRNRDDTDGERPERARAAPAVRLPARQAVDQGDDPHRENPGAGPVDAPTLLRRRAVARAYRPG